jgi:hypothetical protein
MNGSVRTQFPRRDTQLEFESAVEDALEGLTVSSAEVVEVLERTESIVNALGARTNQAKEQPDERPQ